jgi:hypothetical protein
MLLQRLKKLQTSFQDRFNLLIKIKEAYGNEQFDNGLDDSIKRLSEDNAEFKILLGSLSCEFEECFGNVKETSHTTFDEFLNAFELDDVQKQMIIEIFQAFPIFTTIFVSPFIGKHHQDMEESVSYDVTPVTFYEVYFDVFPVPVEKSNEKDLKLFCGIYRNYIKSIDEISRSSTDWKIRLERLSAHFPPFFWQEQINRDYVGRTIESSVSSSANFLLLFPNEPITVDYDAKKYGDQLHYYTERRLSNESITRSGTVLQSSNSKLDGTLQVLVGSQYGENSLGSVHVQFRAGIGLEEDLGDFSEILHLDSDITRGNIQALIRNVLLKGVSDRGLIIFASKGTDYMMNVRVELDQIHFDKREDGSYVTSLETIRRVKKSLVYSAEQMKWISSYLTFGRSVREKEPAVFDEKEVTEKILPVSIKVYKLDRTAKPLVFNSHMDIVNSLYTSMRDPEAMEDMRKKMAAVQCALRRKGDSEGRSIHELRRSPGLSNRLSTPIYVPGSKRNKTDWDVLKEKCSLSLKVSFEGETINDFNAVNVKGSETYLEASLKRLGFELCSFIEWKLRSHLREFRATTVAVTRDAISKYLIESPWPTFPEVSFKKTLVDLNASVEDFIDSEKVVLKFYNLFLLEEAFTNSGEIDHDSFLEYIEACYQDFKGEIECLRKIADFNKSSEEQGLDSRINAPRVFMYGDELDIFHGSCMRNGYLGFYFAVNFIEQDKSWEELLPLYKDVIADAIHQMDLMVQRVGIYHGDINLRNLRFHDNQIHFIDFATTFSVDPTCYAEYSEEYSDLLTDILGDTCQHYVDHYCY